MRIGITIISVVAISLGTSLQMVRGGTPIGNAFIYQGQLKEGGAPANGVYDLVFTLFDQESEGDQVGDPFEVSEHTVTNGLFTVPLDFGADVFDGQALWLEVAVRPCGGEGEPFTMLSPRQPLTAAPYAMYALGGPGGSGGFWAANGSDIYNTNSGNVGIGTTGPIHPLHVGSSVAEAVFSENTSSGGVALRGKASSFEGGGFGVRGDSYGTTGIGVFGIAAMTTGGNYGVYGQSQSQTGRGVYGLANNAEGVNYGVYGQTHSPDGWAGYFDGRSYFGDSVGINHGNPQQPLAVGGDAVTDEAIGAGGTVLISKSDTAPGPGLSVARRLNDSLPSTYHRTEIDANKINAYERVGSTDSAFALELNNESSGDVLLAQGGGKVGIGTTLPDVKLHIDGGGDTSPTGGGHLVLGLISDRNISIDSNEIMARDSGVTSTLYLNADGGDVNVGGNMTVGGDLVVEGTLDIGYEIVENSCPDGGQCFATCPVGKRPIAGGCRASASPIMGSHHVHVEGEEEWSWVCVPYHGDASISTWAICAKVR
jgi:hypothetical protein